MNSNESSEPSAQLPVHQWPWIEFQLIMLSVPVKFCLARRGEESLIDSFFFLSFSFFPPDFCHVCTYRPGRPGLWALWTPQRIDSRPKTEGRDEDIAWAEWLSERGDPQTASEERMGANGSSYPHSCSPRIGGNAQAQQTFIGMYSIGARQSANSVARFAMRQKMKSILMKLCVHATDDMAESNMPIHNARP